MIRRRPVRSRAERAVSGAVVLLVLLLAMKLAYGSLGTRDLGFDDEAAAIQNGITWTRPPPDWAPLYIGWYSVLSIFLRDPAAIYTTSWFILVSTLPLLLYVLARRLGAPRISAACAVAIWVVGRSSETWPFVTLFATCVLGAGLIIATFASSWGQALLVTAMTAIVSSFIRPELAAPSIVLSIAAVAFAIAERRRGGVERRAVIARACALVVPFVGLRLLFGDPMTGDRATFAFGQHYGLNRLAAAHSTLDPWTNWYPIFRASFPTAKTLGAVLRESPSSVAWHVARNAELTPPGVVRFLVPMEYLPNELRRGSLVVLGAMVIAAVVLVTGKRTRRWISRRQRFALPLALTILVAAAGSILLVHPREHYLVPAVFVLLAGIAGCTGALASARGSHSNRWDAAATASALALLVVVVPPMVRGAVPALLDPAYGAPPRHFEGEEAVTFLKTLHPRQPVTILESSYSRGVYARLPFRSVVQTDKNEPFRSFLHSRSIDVVVIDPRLRNDPRFSGDAEFEAFAAGRALEGYELVHLASVPVDVAVRSSLLEASRGSATP